MTFRSTRILRKETKNLLMENNVWFNHRFSSQRHETALSPLLRVQTPVTFLAPYISRPDSLVEPHQFGVTTALHDSVRASNYLLVEYLVLTDFVVGALDVNEETALSLIPYSAGLGRNQY